MGSGSFGKLNIWYCYYLTDKFSKIWNKAQFVDLCAFFAYLGYVFEAIDPHTGESVAIKRTSKSGEYVSREFEVLDRLRGCENVVQLLNIYYSKNEEGKVVQNLVFEFCQ